jgi:E3 ubiquitin-protein ligase listerin
VLDGIILEYAGKILNVAPRLLTTYFSIRGEPRVTLEVWRTLLESLSSQPIYTVLPHLLDAAERRALPGYLKPSQKEFDRSIDDILSDAMDSTSPDALPMLLRIIRYSGALRYLIVFKCLTRIEDYFVTDESFDTFFQQVVATFGEDLSRILHGEGENVAELSVLVDVLAVCLETRSKLALEESVALSLVPDIFALAFLLPKAVSVPDFPVAQEIWTSWLASAPTSLQKQVGAAICVRLQDAIFHTSILVR